MRILRWSSLLVLLAAACGEPSASEPAVGAEPRCGDGTIDPGEGCDDGSANADGIPGACRANCALARCGDGVRDPGEGCDEGGENGAPGAGCTSACALRTCGDGTVQDGEECDEGAANSDESADACRTTCVEPGCGDGVRDAGEGCDEGPANSDLRSGACRRSCRPASCGDAVVDPGEACDEGDENANRADACRLDCRSPACGDGILDGDERCDEGAENSDTSPNACRTSCRPARCGDGVLDAGEACDDGRENDDLSGASCRTTCTPARCGDGVRDPGEACDEGSANSDTEPGACRTTCSLPGCGDGVVDLGEGCDEGAANDDVTPGACRTSCRPAGCGDGVRDAGEACDAGEANSDLAPDACRNSCVPARCGDGVRDSVEACDAGAANSDAVPGACRVACLLPRCGDGVVDPAERCDAGAGNDDDLPGACRTSCLPAGCGDGVVDPGEGCDAGAGNSDVAPGACRTTCAPAGCGDGVRDPGEACDAGTANSDSLPDACRTTCTVARCGDGVADTGEECDGGAANSDTASGACRTACVAAACGDGVVDPGEACDDATANGDAPDACRTTCVLPSCGDGIVDAGEGCDAGVANSDTVPDACRSSCVQAACGDGIVDAGEICDAGVANDDTVAGACRTTCTLPGCGDGVIDAGEACDDGNARPNDGCSQTCVLEPFVCGNGLVEGPEECDDGSVVSGDGCSHHCRWEIPTACGTYSSRFVDLRLVGVPDGEGGLTHLGDTIYSSNATPAGCTTDSTEDVFYLYLPVATGDLVVEAEPLVAGGFRPLLAVRRRCSDPTTELGCTPEPADDRQVLVVPGVSPLAGPLYIHVQGFGHRGKYRLRVRVVPPLVAGAACRTDESGGRCDSAAGLACADPEGDGVGTCRASIAAGGVCDPLVDVCADGTDCFPGNVCSPPCGNGLLEPGEQCDDGNLLAGDNCLPTCKTVGQDCTSVFDLGLEWDAATKSALWRGDTRTSGKRYSPSCGAWSTMSQRDSVARFVVPESGKYLFTLEDLAHGAKLGIYQGVCGGGLTSVTCFADKYLGTGVGGAVDLVAGQELLVVVDGQIGVSAYEIEEGPFMLRVQRWECGDGVVSTHVEDCEDGNLVNGDGCSATCRGEGESCPLPYPLHWDYATGRASWEDDAGGHTGGFYFGGAPTSCVSYVGTGAVARFYAPFAGRFAFELESDTADVIALRNGDCLNGTELECRNRLDGGKTWEAVSETLAAGQEVYVIVGRDNGEPWSIDGNGYVAKPFRVTVRTTSCGDGVVVRPEGCDDGNVVSGDGCDSVCNVETILEVEPNDTFNAAMAATIGRVYRGALGSSDADTFAVSVTAGERYVFETFVGELDTCAFASSVYYVDTKLTLYNSAGVAVAEDDDGGLGGADHCSRLVWRAPTTGTYYLRARSFLGPISRYFVSLRHE